MEVRHAHAAGETRDLGVVPLDREGDRGGSENAEIVSVVRVLPDVFSGENQVSSCRLLNSGVELISPTGTQRTQSGGATPQQRSQHRVTTSDAGQYAAPVKRPPQPAPTRRPQTRIASPNT